LSEIYFKKIENSLIKQSQKYRFIGMNKLVYCDFTKFIGVVDYQFVS